MKPKWMHSLLSIFILLFYLLYAFVYLDKIQLGFWFKPQKNFLNKYKKMFTLLQKQITPPLLPILLHDGIEYFHFSLYFTSLTALDA